MKSKSTPHELMTTLRMIARFRAITGTPPTLREIAIARGLHKSTAHKHFCILVDSGQIVPKYAASGRMAERGYVLTGEWVG